MKIIIYAFKISQTMNPNQSEIGQTKVAFKKNVNKSLKLLMIQAEKREA